MAKSKRNIFGNMALLFASIIAFLILLEAFVRIFGIAPEYGSVKGLYQKDELLDFRMAPNFSGTFTRQEFKTEITTNSYGLRDYEYTGKKPNDFNILALGDSFVWGAYGTSINQTFVKILESKLNENSSTMNYRLINAGVPGYGTDQQLLYLKADGNKFKPDLVLLNFFVGNDFFDNAQAGELTVKDGALVTNKAEIKKTEKIRNFLLLNSHSYRIIERGAIVLFGDVIQRYVRGRIQNDALESGLFIKPASGQIESQFQATRNILDEMNSYLKSKNIKFVVVIIPLDYQVDENRKQIFIQNNLEGKNFDMKQPQKAIAEWAKDSDVFVIDLLPDLAELEKNHDLYWKLNAHFNVQGNEEVADIIFENLK